MLAVASKARHDRALRTRLARMYEVAENLTAPYYEAVAQLVGREMRPPYTFRDLAAAFITVYEGLAIRQSADPDRVGPDELGTLMIPIIVMMTRSHGDDRSAQDWIDEHAPTWSNQPERATGQD